MRRERRVIRPILVLCVASWIVSAPGVDADNGEIALADPIESIRIDGDLSDWSAHSDARPTARIDGEARPEPEDFAATFRAAYSRSRRSIGRARIRAGQPIRLLRRGLR